MTCFNYCRKQIYNVLLMWLIAYITMVILQLYIEYQIPRNISNKIHGYISEQKGKSPTTLTCDDQLFEQ